MTSTSWTRSSSVKKWAGRMGVLGCMGLFCFAPLAVEAQSDAKRSATAGNRGSTSMRRTATPMRRPSASLLRKTGAEKKASTAAAKRGGDAFSESSRNAQEASSGARSDDGQDESDWIARNASDADSEDDAAPDESETLPAAEDFSSRTLGKSCMYGVRGEVIFRPAGTRCRGDGPAVEPNAKAKARASAGATAKRKKRPPAQAAQKLRSPVQPASNSPSDRRSQGSCIVGGDGRVLYAPPGVDCRR